MRQRFHLLTVGLSFATLLAAGTAAAEDQPPPPPPGYGQPEAAPAPDAEGEDKDGVRFRGGIAGAFGGIVGSYSVADYGGFLGGVDGHIGVQIMDLLAIYAVPQIAFGSVTASAGPVDVSEGWLAFDATAVVDFTFIDQIFVGAGGGVAAHAPTCTNCDALVGPALHFRVGGYPLMGYGDDGIRRQGLMVGGDVRINFLSSTAPLGGSVTMIQPMLTVGYEAY